MARGVAQRSLPAPLRSAYPGVCTVRNDPYAPIYEKRCGLKKQSIGFLFLLLLCTVILFSACKETSTPVAPSEGVLFALADAHALSEDIYNLRMAYPDEEGFALVTLRRSEDYQARWAQSLVDDKEGERYIVTAYAATENGFKDLDDPLCEPFELVFEGGSTNLGRLVLVTIEE